MKFLTIDDVDKTVFELIRKEVVRLGYLPDILEGDYEQKFKQMDSQLQGGCIQVFGVGSWQSRGNQSGSRFIIDRYDVENGRIGGNTTIQKEEIVNGEKIFNVYKLPKFSQTITYEIRFTTLYNQYEVVANEVLARAFGQDDVVPCLSEREGTDELTMRINKKGEYDTSGFDFYERIYTFAVEDLFLEQYVKQIKHRVNGQTYEVVPIKETTLSISDSDMINTTDNVTTEIVINAQDVTSSENPTQQQLSLADEQSGYSDPN